MDDLAFDSIDADEAFWLEHPFEEREVLKVMKGTNRIEIGSRSLWLFFHGFLPRLLGCDQERHHGGVP